MDPPTSYHYPGEMMWDVNLYFPALIIFSSSVNHDKMSSKVVYFVCHVFVMFLQDAMKVVQEMSVPISKFDKGMYL
jgi:hypothetical protein